MTHSRGGASAASEHGVAACHLCGELETETHGLPFTDRLDHMGITLPPIHNLLSRYFVWTNRLY